jgi:hypothetical protein
MIVNSQIDNEILKDSIFFTQLLENEIIEKHKSKERDNQDSIMARSMIDRALSNVPRRFCINSGTIVKYRINVLQENLRHYLTLHENCNQARHIVNYCKHLMTHGVRNYYKAKKLYGVSHVN